jgi:GNAT superfamily N-acetyltransferase
MVLPSYQKKGIGKQLLDEYLKTYAKKKKTYYFNSTRLLDLFYMKDKFNIKNIMTTNYYNYTIECYK